MLLEIKIGKENKMMGSISGKYFPEHEIRESCNVCNGTGIVGDHYCPNCKGEKSIIITERNREPKDSYIDRADSFDDFGL
jgi:DnaJ-class molecular chaperone